MPEQWMSVIDAASLMKVHTRTVERRIAAGKIESRRGNEGQVQVLISVPDLGVGYSTAGTTSAAGSMGGAAGTTSSTGGGSGTTGNTSDSVPNEAFETVKEMADRQVDLAAGTASALVRVAQEQAMRAENQLALARQDAGRYRRESKWAMGMFVALLVALIVGVSWCTQIVTAARADRQHALDQATQATEDAKIARQNLAVEETKSVQLAAGRANAEGELNAYKTTLTPVVEILHQKAAPTQPKPFFQRLTTAFVGD